MRWMLPVIALFCTAPLAARDSLGIFGDWGAFRDRNIPRCYAIAMAEQDDRGRDYQPFVSIGTWPAREIRGQIHVRLSKEIASGSAITLTVEGRRFALTGGGGDAWARDRQMDAAIVAAMRSADSMRVSARDSAGRRFTDNYRLEGVATAMDAATVGCARLKQSQQ